MLLMVFLVCIEGIWVLYSFYTVILIVLVFFSGYLTFLAVFPYSPGFAGGTLGTTSLYLLHLLLHFSLCWFNISSANFSSVKLVY